MMASKRPSYGPAARKVLDYMAAHPSISSKNGRATRRVAKGISEPTSVVTGALGTLEDKGLVERDTRSKRTYKITLTPLGEEKARNPYYATTAATALLLWLQNEATEFEYETTAGMMGKDLAVLIDNGEQPWRASSMISAIRKLQHEGKIIVDPPMKSSQPRLIRLALQQRPQPDPAQELARADVEPAHDLPKGECTCHWQDPFRCVLHREEYAKGGLGPAAAAANKDPLDYDALAQSLLTQVMEQAANPPVVVRRDTALQREYEAAQQELRRVNAELAELRRSHRNLLREQERMTTRYNTCVQERNDALRLAQQSSPRSTTPLSQRLSAESRANLERLMKNLPEGRE